jgi:antitoxin HicB
MRYPVTVTKDSNGTFLVRFPDVPDAITFGETKEEALMRAQDALLTVFDAYMKDRRDIPLPSERAGVSVVELPALETSKIELYRAMLTQKVNKSELARRLDWHLPQVDRVINVRHGSQIEQIEAAFAALGKKLVVNVIDAGTVGATLRATVVRRQPRTVHAGVLAAARQHGPRYAAAAGRSSVSRAKRAAKKR